MDSQDYLDQISRSARPPKRSKGGIGGILGSKWLKWGGLALVLLIVIVILGSVLSGGTTLKERCTDFKLHIDRTTQVISQYQPLVKSSMLRSLSESLKSVLVNTSSKLNAYMVNTYAYDEGKLKEAVVLEADAARDELLNELFNAKINGLLDRTYAHKMTNEIHLIMGDEAGIIKDSSDTNLKSLMEDSYNSLNNLYTQFNDFSETKVK